MLLKSILIILLLIYFINGIVIEEGDNYCEPMIEYHKKLNLTQDKYSIRCYLNIIESMGNHSCNWDNDGTDKHEGGRVQFPTVIINEYIGVFKKINATEKDKILVTLYQQYSASTNKMLVYNKNEHLAFFQVGLEVKNEVQPEYDCSYRTSHMHSYTKCVKLLYYGPKTSINTIDQERTFQVDKGIKLGWLAGGNLNVDQSTFNGGLNAGINGESNHGDSNKIKETYKLKEWDVIGSLNGTATTWNIYQVTPFNSLSDTADNFHSSWMSNVCHREVGTEKRKFSKDLPIVSRNSVDGCLFSVYELPIVSGLVDNGIIRIGTSVKHILGDMVVGSIYDKHNSYRTFTHGKVQIKYFNASDGSMFNPFLDIRDDQFDYGSKNLYSENN